MKKGLNLYVVFMLILISGICAAQNLVINRNVDSLELVFEGRRGLYLIEKSSDLQRWVEIEALLVEGSSTVSQAFPQDESSGFYRGFGPVNETSDFVLEVNTQSHSEHLARIHYRDSLVVDYFGTRHNDGLPNEVTIATMSFGGRIANLGTAPEADLVTAYNQSSDLSLRLPRPEDPLPDLSELVTIGRTGFLVVSRGSEDTPKPSEPPVVQVVAYDALGGGTQVYDVVPQHLEERGLDDIYTYKITFGQTSVEHNVEIWSRFAKSLACLPGSLTGIGFPKALVCLADVGANPPRTWPPEWTETGLSDIHWANYRGVVYEPRSTIVEHSSQWYRYDGFSPEDELDPGELPTIIIDIDPPSPNVITRTGTFNLTAGAVPASADVEFDFSEELASVEVSRILRIEWFITHNHAPTLGNILLDSWRGGSVWIARNGVVSMSADWALPELISGPSSGGQSGRWNLGGGTSASILPDTTVYGFEIKGGRISQELASYGDPDHFRHYYDPFVLEIVAQQSHEATPSRVADVTVEDGIVGSVFGSITISVYFSD